MKRATRWCHAVTEVLAWEILQDKQDSKHTSSSITLLASVYLWDELMLNDDRTF